MKLVIGGYAQGKLNYVLQKYGQENCIVWEGVIPDQGLQDKLIIFNQFHEWVRECIFRGGCPEEEAYALVEKYPDSIIISDEIGNGIVPIDAFERECRERTGRILVELASRAAEVERVICGIGQKIK